MSENTLWSGCKRFNAGGSKSWANIKDPLDGRCVLVDYDTIPSTSVRKYDLPTKAELLKQMKAADQELKAAELAVAGSALTQLHARTVCSTDYNYFFTQAGLTATPTASVEAKATQLTEAAGWLRLLAGLETRHQLKSLGFERKDQARAAVLDQVLPLNLYGLRVSNVRVLQSKELAFAKALQLTSEDVETGLSAHQMKQRGRERALLTLVPKRTGLANAQKIGRLGAVNDGQNAVLLPSGRVDMAEWHANTIATLFMNPGKGGKFDMKEVYRRYLRRCQATEREPICQESGMRAFLSRRDVRQFTAWEREGHAALEQYLPHVRRERPAYALAKGGYDGFSVDFYTNVDGATVMLTVVAVFDYHSEAITGFAVGLVENGRLVRDMYRNHLSLMDGRSYIEIESDRFSGNLAKDTKAMFGRACQYVTQPAPNDPRGKAPNPKARFVERLLAEVNRLTQSVPGWKGTNITSIDKNRKPNPDYAGSESQATLEVGIRQISKLVALYNHQEREQWNGQSRWQRLLADLHPEAPVLDELTRATLLNQHVVTSVRHAVVKLTVGKKEVEFPFPNYSRFVHLMAKGLKVRAYYDETNLGSIDVFGFTDAKDPGTDMFLATLGRGQRVQMAKAEQTHGDLVELGKQQQQRQEMREELDRKQLEMEAVAYELEVPAGIGLKALRAMVAGARLTATVVEDFDTRYAHVLTAPAAAAHLDFYDDSLLRDQGHRVPVPVEPPAKGASQDRNRYDSYKDSGYDFS
ncbi:hypothetical protein [Hymenobacter rubripertinctus]|uniref:hypothetical protein n=1 Tax=Hymenobacter rubripertinctus TaxID=2029981 RepID=UPI0011C456A0|nr:hypothetical protein [Hymenobacter rubripertinctus]